jgi:D-glycero-alpha-D-manno-heptose-7-phosphate kinase
MQTLDDLRPEALEGELRIPIAAIKYVGLERGANIFLASEIPPGTGLGSSGAVSVCMVKALAAFQQRQFDPYALAETAYHINSGLLDHPGGKQDEYGAAFGGLKHIEFRAEGVTVRPLDLDPMLLRELDANIMLFFTGSARASASILTRQSAECAEEKGSTVDALTEMRQMVDEALDLLDRGALRRFGELLDTAWEAKKRVTQGISTPYIDGLYDLARAQGAIGGKIAGAGGGGFLMLYCEADARPAVARALRDAGAREMLFRFDYDGATVVYDDPLFGSDASLGAGAEWHLLEL